MTEIHVPVVIIVFGLPGSGKSYFASAFADLIKAEYLNSDKLRMNLLSNRIYSEEEKMLVYDIMLLKVKEAVTHKKNVVADASFYKDSIREKYVEHLKQKAKVLFIEVQAREDLISERLVKARQFSEADFEVYKKIKNQWEPLKKNHLTIHSTDNNLAEILLAALIYFLYHDKQPN